MKWRAKGQCARVFCPRVLSAHGRRPRGDSARGQPDAAILSTPCPQSRHLPAPGLSLGVRGTLGGCVRLGEDLGQQVVTSLEGLRARPQAESTVQGPTLV